MTPADRFIFYTLAGIPCQYFPATVLNHGKVMIDSVDYSTLLMIQHLKILQKKETPSCLYQSSSLPAMRKVPTRKAINTFRKVRGFTSGKGSAKAAEVG